MNRTFEDAPAVRENTPSWARPRTPKWLPDADLLNQIFVYSRESGLLGWRENSERSPGWNAKFAGQVAGYSDANGYRHVSIRGASFLVHRLIWKMVHGWNPDQMDHINGNPGDNRLVNLRSVTNAQNRMNCFRRKPRALPRGVVLRSDGLAFMAQISAHGKHEYLGSFADPQDAHAAYLKRAKELFGDFRGPG